jgi:hypothetical protein
MLTSTSAKEDIMSRMGQFIMELQEEAYEMSKDDFLEAYGHSFASFWEEVNGESIPPAPVFANPNDEIPF